MKKFTRGNRPQPVVPDQGRDAGDDPKAARETPRGEAFATGVDNDPVTTEAPPQPVEKSPLRDHAQDDVAATHGDVITRVVFRFCCVYFALFCLGTQILIALLGATNLIRLGVSPAFLSEIMRWIQLRPLW